MHIYICSLSIYTYVCTYTCIHISIISAGPPCGGHQAARGFIIVSMLLSLQCFKFSSFSCILHSLLVSSFLSKFYSCSASLFLGCYRAHRPGFKHRLTVSSQPGPFQGIPGKSLIFRPTPRPSKIRKSESRVPKKLLKRHPKVD